MTSWVPTPMESIRLDDADEGVALWAKLESSNPTASVKDRTAHWMVDAAESSGALEPGGTIVESSSGNTGIALAALGARRGYRVVIVCSERVPPEKRMMLELLRAEVVTVPDAELGTDKHYLARAQQIADDLGGVFVNQYENPANPAAHYATTGPEIWRQRSGRVDIFVAGAGTGGTITGTARYLREKNPTVEVVLADPVGSIYAHAHATGELTDPQPYAVEAVGQAERMIPSSIDLGQVDRVESIPDDESFAAVHRAAAQGLLVGPSAGLALAAALRVAAQAAAGTQIVTIFPDSAGRYLSRGIR